MGSMAPPDRRRPPYLHVPGPSARGRAFTINTAAATAPHQLRFPLTTSRLPLSACRDRPTAVTSSSPDAADSTPPSNDAGNADSIGYSTPPSNDAGNADSIGNSYHTSNADSIGNSYHTSNADSIGNSYHYRTVDSNANSNGTSMTSQATTVFSIQSRS